MEALGMAQLVNCKIYTMQKILHVLSSFNITASNLDLCSHKA